MNLLNWFRDAPIKRKLLLVGLLLPAVALLVVSFILTAKDVFEWRGRTVSELTSYAKVIGSNAAPAMLFDDRAAAIETLSALSVRPDIVHAIIYDRNGNVFAVYDNRSRHRDYLPTIAPGEHLFTLDYLAISNAIHFKNDTLGSIYIESNLRGLYAGVLRSVGLIFLTAFGVFLLAAVLFARLQKIILAPIMDMSGAMRRVIAEQDFAVRVAFQGKDEVGALAETFNVMLEHIQQRDAELLEHREHLEEQVAQRTAGLIEAQRIAHLGSFDWNVISGELQWTAEHFRLWGLEPYVVTPDYELFRRGLHPDDVARVEEILQQALHGGRSYDCEHRVVWPDGSMRHIHGRGEVIFDDAGRAVRMTGTVQDITGFKQAEQDMRIAATAFESQEGIMIADRDGRIVRVNGAFTRVTGYSAEEAIGQTPAMLQSGRQDKAFYRSMWDSIVRARFWQGEVWNRRKNGEIYPEWLTITAVTDADEQVTHYVAVFSDITLRKRNEGEIHNLAFFDPLTQLPNRRLLMDRLSHALVCGARSVENGALLYIDLDNFKIINDTQGHAVGDLLLIESARRLRGCLREGDTVARLGGDEFVVILEGLNAEAEQAAIEAEAVGQKIRASLNEPYLLNGVEYHSSCSIGIGLFHDHEVTVDELLKRADMAMYEAKNSGRDMLRFFDPVMQTRVEERSMLEADLRRAITGQDQFLLYYQVQVDLAGGWVGAEALVRWRHPERGLVSPVDFIPLAEESGLILPLGHWVLTAACRQLADWAMRPETAHLTLAVNISAKQFRLPTFVEMVCALVDEFGVNPENLKLEITESMLLDDVDDIVAKMMALKERGIAFSLDDFGTGYSSLSYLKRLPLCQLKIDQSFVNDVLDDPNDAAIIKAIIALAQSMNLAVIAEGVETEAQRMFLELNGCHAFQGYLFSRPIPVAEFEQLIAGAASLPDRR